MRFLLVFLAVIVLDEGYASDPTGGASLCDFCQEFIVFWKERLGSVGDRQELAMGFCKRTAPFLLRGPCKSLVADKMGAVVDLLKNKVDLTKICTIMKYCNN